MIVSSKYLVTVYKALLIQRLQVDHFRYFPMRVTLKKDVFLVGWLLIVISEFLNTEIMFLGLAFL